MLFLIDKGFGFLGKLLQVVGQNSILIYGLAIVHLYIHSTLMMIKVWSCFWPGFLLKE